MAKRLEPPPDWKPGGDGSWLTKEEIAARARCSQRTIERRAAKGVLEVRYFAGRMLSHVSWVDEMILRGGPGAVLIALMLFTLLGAAMACACGSSVMCHFLRELGFHFDPPTRL